MNSVGHAEMCAWPVDNHCQASYIVLQTPRYARGRTLRSEVLEDCHLTEFPVSFCARCRTTAFLQLHGVMPCGPCSVSLNVLRASDFPTQCQCHTSGCSVERMCRVR